MKTKFNSYSNGKLPEGCKLCVKGKKTVIYITGICPRHCTFCPLSEKKKDKDVIYANETKLTSETNSSNTKSLIKEAKSHYSKGAGITGGDPLAKIERTVHYIKELKKEFGQKYHIHLYTSFNLVNKKTLSKLNSSGLDEIRFHPDLDDDKLWEKLNLALSFDWDVGIEIPMIPDKLDETKKLVDFIHGKVKFINLNEFEYSDAGNFKGYVTRNPSTYAIKNSLESGFKIMEYIRLKNKKSKEIKLKVHLCTAKLKDAVQLRNRMKLRAKGIKKKFDKINSDGLLIRNCIYLKDHSPRNKKIISLKKDSPKYLSLLKKLIKKQKLLNYYLDIDQARIITTKRNLKKLQKKEIEGVDLCIVEEYPTDDKFITSISFLN